MRGVSRWCGVMRVVALMLVAGCHQEAQPHPGDPSLVPGDPGFIEHGRNYYSPHGEERIIRHFFQDRRGGVFVDVGVAHYRKRSTTYYLEKHLGWSGIGIGMNTLPEHRRAYEKYRPRTRLLENLGATSTLGELLERESITNIDFVSLNIGASATMLLMGLDIRRFRPELVRVELHPGTSEQLIAYFTEQGYERIDEYLRYDRASWYFRPRVQ